MPPTMGAQLLGLDRVLGSFGSFQSAENAQTLVGEICYNT